MVWRDVLHVDGALAQYLRLKESMPVEGNEPYLRDLLHKRVQSDTDLLFFPQAVMWPSPLRSGCLSALRLKFQEGFPSSSRDAQSWKLQEDFLTEQVKGAHRRDCAASRQRVSCGEIFSMYVSAFLTPLCASQVHCPSVLVAFTYFSLPHALGKA